MARFRDEAAYARRVESRYRDEPLHPDYGQFIGRVFVIDGDSYTIRAVYARRGSVVFNTRSPRYDGECMWTLDRLVELGAWPLSA